MQSVYEWSSSSGTCNRCNSERVMFILTFVDEWVSIENSQNLCILNIMSNMQYFPTCSSSSGTCYRCNSERVMFHHAEFTCWRDCDGCNIHRVGIGGAHPPSPHAQKSTWRTWQSCRKRSTSARDGLAKPTLLPSDCERNITSAPAGSYEFTTHQP